MSIRLTEKCLLLPGKDKEKQGAPRKIEVNTRLQLFLHWMKYYLPEKFLACQFHCSQSCIEHNLFSTLNEFIHEFQSTENPEVHFPNRKSRDNESVIIFGLDGIPMRISVLLDGSEQQIQVPSNGGKQLEQAYFSGKSQLHTRNFQLTASPRNGIIYHVSKGQPGAKNDINNYSKVENQIHRNLDQEEIICADNIYGFIENKYNHRIIVPFGREESKGNSFKIEYSNYVARFRTMIENVFAHLKKMENMLWCLQTFISNSRFSMVGWIHFDKYEVKKTRN